MEDSDIEGVGSCAIYDNHPYCSPLFSHSCNHVETASSVQGPIKKREEEGFKEPWALEG